MERVPDPLLPYVPYLDVIPVANTRRLAAVCYSIVKTSTMPSITCWAPLGSGRKQIMA